MSEMGGDARVSATGPGAVGVSCAGSLDAAHVSNGPRRIGLTGGIGAGKSSVARVLAEFGHVVFDADLLVREVVHEQDVRAAVVALLGPGAYDAAGTYDRGVVRERVFADPALRSGLEGITHPAVARRFDSLSAALGRISPSAWIFYEASLLVETGRAGAFDALVLVTAPEEERVSRLSLRSGLTRDQALAVMAAQWSDERKRASCHFEIRNGGDPAALPPAVHGLLGLLRERFSPRGP